MGIFNASEQSLEAFSRVQEALGLAMIILSCLLLGVFLDTATAFAVTYHYRAREPYASLDDLTFQRWKEPIHYLLLMFTWLLLSYSIITQRYCGRHGARTSSTSAPTASGSRSRRDMSQDSVDPGGMEQDKADQGKEKDKITEHRRMRQDKRKHERLKVKELERERIEQEKSYYKRMMQHAMEQEWKESTSIEQDSTLVDVMARDKTDWPPQTPESYAPVELSMRRRLSHTPPWRPLSPSQRRFRTPQSPYQAAAKSEVDHSKPSDLAKHRFGRKEDSPSFSRSGQLLPQYRRHSHKYSFSSTPWTVDHPVYSSPFQSRPLSRAEESMIPKYATAIDDQVAERRDQGPAHISDEAVPSTLRMDITRFLTSQEGQIDACISPSREISLGSYSNSQRVTGTSTKEGESPFAMTGKDSKHDQTSMKRHMLTAGIVEPLTPHVRGSTPISIDVQFGSRQTRQQEPSGVGRTVPLGLSRAFPLTPPATPHPLLSRLAAGPANQEIAHKSTTENLSPSSDSRLNGSRARISPNQSISPMNSTTSDPYFLPDSPSITTTPQASLESSNSPLQKQCDKCDDQLTTSALSTSVTMPSGFNEIGPDDALSSETACQPLTEFVYLAQLLRLNDGIDDEASGNLASPLQS